MSTGAMRTGVKKTGVKKTGAMSTSRSGPPLAQMLTRRLLVIAALVFCANTVAVGLYYGADRRTLEKAIVAGQSDRIGAALHNGTLPPTAPERALFADHPAAYALALIDAGGRVTETINPALIPPAALSVGADDWITRIDRPGGRLLMGGHAFGGPEAGLRMVFVMQDDPARLLWRAYLAEFRGHVWLPILPLVLVLLGANTYLIRRGLAPISAAAAWARGLRPGAPTPPPQTVVPAEIADLVDATERSVQRLAHALETERRRAAEAAHALRTPVAVLVARLDGLPPGAPTDQLRADLEALSRTVQQVLAAARADVMVPEGCTPIDLRAPVEAVVAALAPYAYERGVALSLGMPPAPVPARADAEGVELAVSNLIENAIQHGGPGAVQVTLGPGPTLMVRDHGPGLPEGAPTRLCDPFWRGPAAPPGGAGLGLAIVARLQQAQGGTLRLETAPGGGALGVLDWPAA